MYVFTIRREYITKQKTKCEKIENSLEFQIKLWYNKLQKKKTEESKNGILPGFPQKKYRS